MPPRCAPRAYRSRGSSFKRPPGIRKERGTQHGASRTIPSPAFSASEAILLLDMTGLRFFDQEGASRHRLLEGFQRFRDIGSLPDCTMIFDGDLAFRRDPTVTRNPKQVRAVDHLATAFRKRRHTEFHSKGCRTVVPGLPCPALVFFPDPKPWKVNRLPDVPYKDSRTRGVSKEPGV